MSRSSRRTRQSQPDPNNDEEMEVDSESEEVSRSMRRMNVSQNACRGRNKSKQVDVGSEEEQPVSQRMNGSRKGQRGKGKPTARQVDSDSEEEPPVSQKTNGSRKGQEGKGKPTTRQVDSDSEEEPPVSQRTNGSRKGQGGKGKCTARQVNSDSDEEPQPSTSQASQKRKKNTTSNQSQRARQTLSQASTSRAGETLYDEDPSASQISPDTSLTEQEFDHHVANVVKYILAADQSNNPIDKSSISKDVGYNNKKFKNVFTKAQDVLKDVFGYELKELVEESQNDGGNQAKQTKSSNLKYILVNTVNCEDEIVNNLCEDIDDETSIHYVLLFLTLAHIFMTGDKCTEDSLKSFLKKLEIVTDNHTRHEDFGDAMEVIKKVFTKEKYINYNKKDDEFSWGMRATIELKPRAVMNFISEVYNGKSLDSWPQEYQRLLDKEQNQNQRPNGQINGANH